MNKRINKIRISLNGNKIMRTGKGSFFLFFFFDFLFDETGCSELASGAGVSFIEVSSTAGFSTAAFSEEASSTGASGAFSSEAVLSELSSAAGAGSSFFLQPVLRLKSAPKLALRGLQVFLEFQLNYHFLY